MLRRFKQRAARDFGPFVPRAQPSAKAKRRLNRSSRLDKENVGPNACIKKQRVFKPPASRFLKLNEESHAGALQANLPVSHYKDIFNANVNQAYLSTASTQ
jgi:hypothetical protein